MNCLNCGKELKQVLINEFRWDGSDSERLTDIEEFESDEENKGVVIRTTTSWTGYELTDEERKETILCPHCKKYPFSKNDEIQISEPVEIICFTK
jgi:hypothetical protein